MRVRVKFRYDPVTGEVAMFQVEDVSTGPQEADHNARHDRITSEIAGLIERGAHIVEVAPGQLPDRLIEPTETPETEDEQRERRRDG
ncbi:hypothetical protein GCM10009555_019730 [Acrocarpospora macrocephala]|uniref:FtsH ternary system domain-containing protein n=1 Tax=Acrocarpospora macrocephala TaxID=150177 RepID=A0A5M3WG10_9ACTN|nr:hypothetical protein [Acrocarpospora macrocephala]GES08027.1 hypothetical protein Amac_016220 [Acrocarpospora macrocephala]